MVQSQAGLGVYVISPSKLSDSPKARMASDTLGVVKKGEARGSIICRPTLLGLKAGNYRMGPTPIRPSRFLLSSLP